MKNISFLVIIAFTALSTCVHATESVDCGNEEYWLQIHRNISTDEYAGFTLYKAGEIVVFESVTIKENIFNSETRELKFIAEPSSGQITLISLNATGKTGTLEINAAPYDVECDWSFYDIN